MMYFAGICTGVLLVCIMASISGAQSESACMDASGATACELKWVPSGGPTNEQ